MITQKENVDNWAIDISRSVTSIGEIRDVEVINQSIESILGTSNGERIFFLDYGSSLINRLFEIQTVQAGEDILKDIKNQIQFWDDRIIVDDANMRLQMDTNNNSCIISIPYIIKKNSVNGLYKKKIIS